MSGDFDINKFKQLSKMKSVEEVDEALLQSTEMKGEFQSAKEFEELKETVSQQQILLHAMWLTLKDFGATNDQFSAHLKEAAALSTRTDFKNVVSCPSCGKGMQKMEKVPFTLKCYYCGYEHICNPFMKYDGLNPEAADYKTTRSTSEELDEQSKPEQYEQKIVLNEQEEIANAEAILNTNYEPYDVSKDLNFEDEGL